MKSCFLLPTLCLVGLAEFAVAQQAPVTSNLLSTSSSSTPSSVNTSASELSACNQYRLQTDTKLTFKQRFCFYGEQLITPQFALQAGVMAVFGHMSTAPYAFHQRIEDLPQRFGYYYARHAARDAGEMIVGYLHHEDARPRRSNQQGFVRRSQAALFSVVATKDEKGNNEIAFAPMAGSLSSGMVSMLTGRKDTSFEHGLQHAGFVYSTYFISAWFREFKPELSTYAHKLLHHGKQD